jgi:hypothetical protein
MGNELIIVIGAYGSGKSEYSIHLARELHISGKKVALADMDVVNPYFRSRDVQESFEQIGIEVIAPEGQFKHADLPMISPRIRGAIQNPHKTVILDVGGDPAGCRTLGRFVEDVNLRGYRMLLVVNTLRPFTSTVPEILTMLRNLEFSSKLKVTEMVCNTNLMEYTDAKVVEEGLLLVREAAALAKVEFHRYLVLEEYQDIVADGLQGMRRIVMSYTLKKPWEQLLSKGI